MQPLITKSYGGVSAVHGNRKYVEEEEEEEAGGVARG